jgi:glycosyltransferase involved in cell wall biosynthesis
MRLVAFILAPLYLLAVNENLNDFMLRPGSLPAIARHLAWRTGNFVRWHLSKEGWLAQRGWHDVPYGLALAAGWLRVRRRGSRLAGGGTGWKAGPQAELPAPQGSGAATELSSAAPCSRGSVAILRSRQRNQGIQFCAVPGNDSHYALCGDEHSFYDSGKVRQLGGLDPAYDTTEVRYLELCYRAWQRGWPTVGLADPHSLNPLDNLKFLARAIFSPRVFRDRWAAALANLHAAARGNSEARSALWRAPAIALGGGPSVTCDFPEELFLALTNGTAAVYTGKPASGKPRVLVVSAYLPFPLSHGGAVRIHNLTSRAAPDWDQILVCFSETDAPPPSELLERFVEVVLVRRAGSHLGSRSERPEVVEQFASMTFRAALRLAVRQWQPAIAQLEFTHMAQYAEDCAPARPILVEHDITFDLYQQLAQGDPDWDLQRELKRWRRFETAAWKDMACVVTMSARDQALVNGSRSVVLPNGVDLDRFRFSPREPEAGRLLFVGSFSHLPNLMAVAFFLNDAWPRLSSAVPNVRLHIIAGANHEYFLDYQSRQVQLNLDQPGIEVEGFVSDVRPAYSRAAIVIAPLVASAGTNLKILEAMACGRPVVSTPAGVNGLDLVPDRDFILVQSGAQMADAIADLLASPEECRRLAAAGRRRVEECYGWDEIARRQSELYRELCARI